MSCGVGQFLAWELSFSACAALKSKKKERKKERKKKKKKRKKERKKKRKKESKKGREGHIHKQF